MKRFKKVFSVLSMTAFLALSSQVGFAEEDILQEQVEITDIKEESIESESLHTANPNWDAAYSKIVKGFLDLEPVIDVSGLGLKANDQKALMEKVIRENPEIFYSRGWFYSYSQSSGAVINIKPTYDYDVAVIKSMRSEIDSKVTSIVSELSKPNMTELEKVLAVHDYLALNIAYDERAALPFESYNLYGALIEGRAVCEGYSESFVVLLEKLGVESSIVVSDEMVHAWNMVVLNGKNYHVDVTWNDPVPDRKGEFKYQYLLADDAEISKDHNWRRDAYPTAISGEYSWLWKLNNPRYTDGVITHVNESTGVREEIVLERPVPEEPVVPEIKPEEPVAPEPEVEKPQIEEPVPEEPVTYISGYPDGTFRPNKSVKRAEISSMISNILKLPKSEAAFSDIDSGYWAFSDIGSLQIKGIVNGDEKGFFNPEKSLTRGEMAKIAYSVYSGEFSESTEFADVSSHWAKSYIEQMAKAGILKGYGNGVFDPERPVSRAEAVVILNRLFKTKDDFSRKQYSFTDIDSHWAFPEILKAYKGN